MSAADVTSRLAVDPEHPDPAAIAEAARVLAHGGLVALPTETVYGLAGVADDAKAVGRIFEAKGRPAYNPLIVHVASLADARALAREWPAAADRLARSAWPGPLTLVVERNPDRVPEAVTAGGSTVALRVPAHPVALAVLRTLGRPIAAPSANRFQSLSPTTADHVMKSLSGRIDLVLDGGPCARGIESTVVDCTTTPPTLLRPGALSVTTVRDLVGEVALASSTSQDDAALRSPGLLDKHYAPTTRLVVVRSDAVREAIRDLGPGVAVVSHRGPSVALPCREWVRMPDSPEAYGAALYATLHRLDESGHDAIVVEAVPDDEDWLAVRDRLARAAG